MEEITKVAVQQSDNLSALPLQKGNKRKNNKYRTHHQGARQVDPPVSFHQVNDVFVERNQTLPETKPPAVDSSRVVTALQRYFDSQ